VAEHAETADSRSLAFLVLLESLSPVERAVFLLRDVFGYGYDEIGEVVGKERGQPRQIAVRARRHVEEGKPRFDAPRKQRDELARRFFEAPRTATPRV
jgi:RNA polymerase sigma-70 factor, ECF subfamily